MFPISYLVYSVNYFAITYLVYTGNDKDQSEWR